MFFPAFHMCVDERNSVRSFTMSRRTKNSGGPILSVQQEVSHFDVWRHFWQIHAYFENYLVLELKHHSLHINSVIIFMPWRTKVMEIIQLRQTLVGGAVETIFSSRRQASRLYNFNIQFPIHTKLLINVEAVSPNKSPHQYLVGHFDLLLQM